MKKVAFFTLLSVLFAFNVNAQKYVTKNGLIRFSGETSLEKIEGSNRQVNAALDANSGDFVFRILMKSFVFQKALMQEHFNENYVESDTYPSATFLGKVSNIKDINTNKEGTYPAEVEGKLTIHGVTKTVKVKGEFEIMAGRIQARAKFNVALADYNITVPAAVANNVAKSMEVTVELVLDKFSK